MNKILIVVDLGHFKAYRVSKEPMESTRIDLIDSFDTIEGHAKLGEKLSDSAGRFKRSEGKKSPASGYGEPHNLIQENEKKVVKSIAKNINSLIKKENCKTWELAAAAAINRQIIDNLNPEVKNRMGKSISADLTKIDKTELLDHFQKHA